MFKFINFVYQDVSLVFMCILNILHLGILVEIKFIFQSKQLSLMINLNRAHSVLQCFNIIF